MDLQCRDEVAPCFQDPFSGNIRSINPPQLVLTTQLNELSTKELQNLPTIASSERSQNPQTKKKQGKEKKKNICKYSLSYHRKLPDI